MRYKAYPFRLYPHKANKRLIHQTHGHGRFVYNYFIELWHTTYKEKGKDLNRFSRPKMLTTKMKKQDETT